MSPSDLGEVLKPFVFLDRFQIDAALLDMAPLHPHSGIGTITVVAEGDMRFDDPKLGKGVISVGGVEWMRAGSGVWHGSEMKAGSSDQVIGFQLWVALTPELESEPSLSEFIEARFIPCVGPARVLIGEYAGAHSPATAPSGITCLLVELSSDQSWSFRPPAGHDVAFLSVAKGALVSGAPAKPGELIGFEQGEIPIDVKAGPAGASFLLGSAIQHGHELVLGSHSVHTSRPALEAGQARIKALRPR